MKRLIAVILITIMLLSLSACSSSKDAPSDDKTEEIIEDASALGANTDADNNKTAESANLDAEDDTPKVFDWEQLSDEESFHYDKFDKTWQWAALYQYYFSDAGIKIVILSQGGNGLEVTALSPMLTDLNGNTIPYPFKSIDILIDDDTYSYKNMAADDEISMVILGENGNLLIEALAFCDPNSVSARIASDDGSLEFDLDPIELTNTLKHFCRRYLEVDLWSFCTTREEVQEYESQYPLTINGKKADYATMKKDRDLSRIDETFTVPDTDPTNTPAETPNPTPTPTPTQTPTPTPAPTVQPKETAVPNNVIRPKVKEMLDSYEDYMDEYIAFMEKYASTDASGSLSMLSEYSSMMQRYIDFSEKIDKLGDEDLSNAELSYYLEVTNRVNQKLIKAAS